MLQKVLADKFGAEIGLKILLLNLADSFQQNGLSIMSRKALTGKRIQVKLRNNAQKKPLLVDASTFMEVLSSWRSWKLCQIIMNYYGVEQEQDFWGKIKLLLIECSSRCNSASKAAEMERILSLIRVKMLTVEKQATEIR
ncbi:hypothetical protein SUGI_0803680 [Cryptomeria japonica]|nr:hypothetical protein SUGI_0803680 [Cryptomeria japonica]